jgi:outer membrane receptor protein involved in Fe transport
MLLLFRCVVLLAIALVTFAGTSVLNAAQQPTTISGVVSDQTGASIAGAKIEFVRGLVATRSVVTDSDGRYQVEGLQPSEYTVRVTARGFRSMERPVNVTAWGSAVADFRLAVQALEENVVVTGERLKAEIEAQRALTPGGVTIVEGEELYRRQINGLADMLRYVPGVWAESSSGSEELFFSSRGSNLDATDYDKNGIKLLQDGLPITTADGNNHNRVIDPLTARYASVARGANALTYGASTLGGAIDFTSPTARNSAPLSVLLNGGSYGSLNGRVTVGGAGDALDGLLTVEGRQWNGYRDHSGQERWGLYANAGWQPSATNSVQVFGTYVHNDQRLPGALTRAEADADPDQASAAAIDGNYGKVVKTARLATKTTWSFGANGSLAAGLSYEGQSLFHPIVNRIFVDFDGPGSNPPVEVFSLLVDTDHRDLGAMVRYDRRMGTHDLLVGLNYGGGSVKGGNYRTTADSRTASANTSITALTALGASFALGDSHRIDPLVSCTLSRFTFAGDRVNGDNDLPAAPTYATRGEVLYRHASGFYAGPTFDFIGPRFADFANSYIVDGYELIGLRAGVSGRHWEVFGEVRNVFDTDYIATISVLNVANADARVLYPGAPLSAYTGVRFSF